MGGHIVRLAVVPSVVAGSAVAAYGLIAATGVESRPALHQVAGADVRLVDSTATADLDALVTGILGGTPVTNLATIESDFSAINDATGLTTLVNDADNLLDLNNAGSSLTTSLGDLLGAGSTSGVENIPYNLLADVLNIPYYEGLAEQEYGFALGPGGSVGGVADWIPPGATVADGGVDVVNGQDYYALGGTGSYLYESIGNTWGWDDGNYPQLDGLAHFLLPFQFTEPIAEQVQGVLQAESIDGADVNCEFQCASFTDYLGQWFHQPLSEVLSPSGYTYPTVLEDTVGATSATGVLNSGGTAGEDVIWSGQTVNLSPDLGLSSILTNLESSPAADPIQSLSLANLLTDNELLTYDFNYDFNFFVEGSFLYWGAPSLYSIPDLIGGEIKDLTGIPNEFLLPNDGAEPLSGYTDTSSSLLPGLEQGFEYLAKGLEGYLDPATYAGLASADSSALASDLTSLVPNLAADIAAMTGGAF
jgi:hypothetical protein